MLHQALVIDENTGAGVDKNSTEWKEFLQALDKKENVLAYAETIVEMAFHPRVFIYFDDSEACLEAYLQGYEDSAVGGIEVYRF